MITKFHVKDKYLVNIFINMQFILVIYLYLLKNLNKNKT